MQIMNIVNLFSANNKNFVTKHTNFLIAKVLNMYIKLNKYSDKSKKPL